MFALIRSLSAQICNSPSDPPFFRSILQKSFKILFIFIPKTIFPFSYASEIWAYSILSQQMHQHAYHTLWITLIHRNQFNATYTNFLHANKSIKTALDRTCTPFFSSSDNSHSRTIAEHFTKKCTHYNIDASLVIILLLLLLLMPTGYPW